MKGKVTLSPEHACPFDAPATGGNRAISRRACDAARLPHLPRQIACRYLLQAFVDSYDGATHRLLTDLADVIGASIAYVDRPTVEAHLERPLSGREWAATAQQFTAMAFDDHVGDAGSVRTDWIEDVLARAGVPGRGHTGQQVAVPPSGVA
ncbi:hypothetical protein DQ237_12965 [Blastococcus sp. TF02-8]|uniref:hypothetical protein n=1 Tax=Blastococcus sp. TF02-8 TaxID=2250574 RepID=UPI000DE8C31C|nr:hypothetical protein [Blastococcus sp. TF02-8]RBY95455.1 hypothetical protein DQ237_12965 [Blastococcus sp. TF02-8]